jgi:Sulfotransferase domain
VTPALRRLDVWYRARRRQRKIVWRLRRSDAIVVTHTKSGRTWLLVMISHLFHLKYGTPEREIVKFDNLHRQDARVPKIYFTRWANLITADDAAPPPALDPATRLIFLFRDPRDIAVSYYFHLHNRSTPVERAHKGVADAVLAKSMFEFVTDAQVGVPHIVALMNRWLARMASLERAILVRYEDLHAAPDAELARVMAFLGEACSDTEIAQAVEFAAFDNLKSREAGNFFASDRLRPVDRADPDSFKVRRGAIGGWRDYFDTGQQAVIDGLVEGQLPAHLGYGRAAPGPPAAAAPPPARERSTRS